MFVVIFRAEIKQLDDAYYDTANALRERALSQFNCIEFTSALEGNHEIALSYWHSKADIAHWKNDEQHKAAQHTGKSRWYKSFSVETAEIHSLGGCRNWD